MLAGDPSLALGPGGVAAAADARRLAASRRSPPAHTSSRSARAGSSRGPRSCASRHAAQPAVDAPAALVHDPATDLVLTGANLADAQAALAWPDAGVGAPTDVHTLPVAGVQPGAVTLPSAGGLATSPAGHGPWRLTVRVGEPGVHALRRAGARRMIGAELDARRGAARRRVPRRHARRRGARRRRRLGRPPAGPSRAASSDCSPTTRSADPARVRLCDELGLDAHAYWLVMLCAAVELHPEAAAAVSLLAEDPRAQLPTPDRRRPFAARPARRPVRRRAGGRARRRRRRPDGARRGARAGVGPSHTPSSRCGSRAPNWPPPPGTRRRSACSASSRSRRSPPPTGRRSTRRTSASPHGCSRAVACWSSAAPRVAACASSRATSPPSAVSRPTSSPPARSCRAWPSWRGRATG